MNCIFSAPVDFEGNTPSDPTTPFAFSVLSCDQGDEEAATSSLSYGDILISYLLFMIIIILLSSALTAWFFGHKKKVTLYSEILGNNSQEGKKYTHD